MSTRGFQFALHGNSNPLLRSLNVRPPSSTDVLHVDPVVDKDEAPEELEELDDKVSAFFANIGTSNAAAPVSETGSNAPEPFRTGSSSSLVATLSMSRGFHPFDGTSRSSVASVSDIDSRSELDLHDFVVVKQTSTEDSGNGNENGNGRGSDSASGEEVDEEGSEEDTPDFEAMMTTSTTMLTHPATMEMEQEQEVVESERMTLDDLMDMDAPTEMVENKAVEVEKEEVEDMADAALTVTDVERTAVLDNVAGEEVQNDLVAPVQVPSSMEPHEEVATTPKLNERVEEPISATTDEVKEHIEKETTLQQEGEHVENDVVQQEEQTKSEAKTMVQHATETSQQQQPAIEQHEAEIEDELIPEDEEIDQILLEMEEEYAGQVRDLTESNTSLNAKVADISEMNAKLQMDVESLLEHYNALAEYTNKLTCDMKTVRRRGVHQKFEFDKERQQLVEELFTWRRRAEELQTVAGEAVAAAEANAAVEVALLKKTIEDLQAEAATMKGELEAAHEEVAAQHAAVEKDEESSQMLEALKDLALDLQTQLDETNAALEKEKTDSDAVIAELQAQLADMKQQGIKNAMEQDKERQELIEEVLLWKNRALERNWSEGSGAEGNDNEVPKSGSLEAVDEIEAEPMSNHTEASSASPNAVSSTKPGSATSESSNDLHSSQSEVLMERLRSVKAIPRLNSVSSSLSLSESLVSQGSKTESTNSRRSAGRKTRRKRKELFHRQESHRLNGLRQLM